MKLPEWTRPVVRLFGAAICGISGAVIAGYFINEPSLLMFPAGNVKMAFPTACCFLLTGLAFLIMSRSENGTDKCSTH